MSEKITLTYLNIRQSIAILLAKLTLADLILAILVVGVYFLIALGEEMGLGTIFSEPLLFFGIFGLFGIIKVFVSSYIVLLWLNEYYEITPEYIIHKTGLIFKKQEHYRIDHVRRVEVEDSFLGEMFNFATVTLYDIRFQKYLDLYLIHNARRYAKLLKDLKPDIETKEDHVWVPYMNKDEWIVAEEQ